MVRIIITATLVATAVIAVNTAESHTTVVLGSPTITASAGIGSDTTV